MFERTPGLIINRVAGTTLSPVLEALIQRDALRLVGRIPHYVDTAGLNDKMPEAFRNCFLKLNIALLSPQSSGNP